MMKSFKGMTLAVASFAVTGALAASPTVVKTSSKSQRVAANSKRLSAKRASSASKSALNANSVLAAKDPESASPDKASIIKSSASSAISASSAAGSNGLTAGSSTASTGLAKKSTLADKIKFGVLFEFYGPSVTDPFSGNQPDLSTGYSQAADTSQQLDTTLIVGYKFNSNISFTLNPVFSTFDHTADRSKNGRLMSFNEQYSSFRLNVGKFAKFGKLVWNGDFRVYPGFGDFAQSTPLYLRTGQNLMYSLTPRITLAAYNTIRYYKRNDAMYDSNPQLHDLRFTISPAFEYQFADGVVGSLSYNMDVRREHVSGDLVDAPKTAGPYFEIGGVIDVSKMLNVNPYIDIYKNTSNIEAWQFGANIAVNIL